ncbi:MAG: hypothetical protein RR400_00675 [Clostridia bacterium]
MERKNLLLTILISKRLIDLCFCKNPDKKFVGIFLLALAYSQLFAAKNCGCFLNSPDFASLE